MKIVENTIFDQLPRDEIEKLYIVAQRKGHSEITDYLSNKGYVNPNLN